MRINVLNTCCSLFGFSRDLLAGLAFCGTAIFSGHVSANPLGANVVAGAVSFSGAGTSNLTIHQSSKAAIINWQEFSIGAGEVTRFVQPGASSISVNRVVSGNPSAIYGQLSANGGVMVINPNGIFVGASGVIDVGGALTLSTLDASNEDLLNGGSTLFRGSGSAGVVNYGTVSGQDVIFLGNYVDNQGRITASRAIALGAGGDILVDQTSDGASISVRGAAAGSATGINNSGVISGGNVELSAHGNAYALAINNSGTVRASGYQFNGGRLTLNAGTGSRITNTGDLYARNTDGSGGQIAIQADSVNLASGRIDASSEVGDGGLIEVHATELSVGQDSLLIADGIDGGSVSLSASEDISLDGRVSAVGTVVGGQVDVSADEISIGSMALIDVSGMNGGRIRVGGGFRGQDVDISNASNLTVSEGALLIADGSLGDGGEVVLWSDGDTLFSGDVSAQATGATGNGGFVEVSGKRNLSFDGMVSTLANNGQNGTLLLDPGDILIANSATAGITLSVETLVGSAHGVDGWDAAALQADADAFAGLIHNTNVLIFTDASIAGSGNITIGAAGSNVDDIHYISDNSLTFLAHGNISVNSNLLNHMDNSGLSSGNINLVAGWDGVLPVNTAANLGFEELSELSWGASNSITQINSAGYQEVSVGSRAGETNIFSGIVLVTSSGTREFAQVGYRNHLLTDPDGYHSSGDINVAATNYVGVLTDFFTNSIADGHAMIGHGGSNSRNLTLLSDNGSVENPLSRYLNADFATVSQAQIDNDVVYKAAGTGSMSGDISVKTDGALQIIGSDDRSFAQVGHGGLGENFDPNDPSSAVAGELSSESISFNGTNVVFSSGITLDATAATTLEEALSASSANANELDITVGSSAGLSQYTLIKIDEEIIGVRTIDNGTQIDMERGLFGTTATAHSVGAEIYVVNVPDVAEREGSIVGYVEGTKTGNITIEALSVEALAGQRTNNDSTGSSYAQIGHGGYNAPGAATGDISVVSQTSVVAHGSGYGDNSWGTFAQIGHGGYNSGAYRQNDIASLVDTVNGNTTAASLTGLGHTGAVLVEAQNGDVILMAGIDSNNYVQIGHGGINSHGNHSGDMVSDGSQTSGALKDGITVSATGNVILDRLDDHNDILNTAGLAYTQIGMGGAYAGGRFDSDIDVDAGGDFELHGGAASGAYSQLGNGGRTDTNSIRRAEGDLTGDISLDVGGNLLMRSGSYGGDSYTQIGHGGSYRYSDQDGGHNGEIIVNVGGDIEMAAGGIDRETGVGYDQISDRNYTQIGHGGAVALGAHYGDVEVNSGGSLTIKTYIGAREYSLSADRYTGTVLGQYSYGQIGNGGYASEDSRGSQLGIGELGSSDITVNINGDISLLSAYEFGSARADVTDQTEDSLDFNGDGVVDALDVTVMAPVQFARDNYTQIGSGGSGASRDQDRTIISDVTVISGGDITLAGGTVDVSTLQSETLNGVNGQTVATNENDVVSVDNYSRIGNGGNYNKASTDGAITVIAAGDINLQAGDGRREMAVIGSGGFDSGRNDDNDITTTRVGDIQVVSGGTITLKGSNAGVSDYRGSEFSYAQIGNDLNQGGFTSSSNITVTATEDIIIAVGSGNMEAYAQIGSGGADRARGDISGTIDVIVGNDLFLTGDEGTTNENSYKYSKIGHGARAQTSQTQVVDRNDSMNNGSWNGDIFVKVGNDLSLQDGFIGHIDSQSRQTSVSSGSGDTIIAVSRSNPNYLEGGNGALVADEFSGFSSANQGLGGELRFYMPNRPSNQIEIGATINGAEYSGTPNGVAVLNGDQIGSENLDYPEFTMSSVAMSLSLGSVELVNNGVTTNSSPLVTLNLDSPRGSFTPEGDYSLINGLGGFYQFYYNNVTTQSSVESSPVGTGSSLQFSFPEINYLVPWEAFELPYALLEFDGYETHWGSLSASEAVETNSIPRFGIEETLDAMFGPRTGGGLAATGANSDSERPILVGRSSSELEADEDRERRTQRALRPAGKAQNVFYLYDFNSNPYSSLSLFGVPFADIPAFSAAR